MKNALIFERILYLIRYVPGIGIMGVCIPPLEPGMIGLISLPHLSQIPSPSSSVIHISQGSSEQDAKANSIARINKTENIFFIIIFSFLF